MPASFAGVRNKTPLEFLSGIPGPASVTEDFGELMEVFNSLPFARQYKEKLLNAAPKVIPGAEDISQKLLSVLSQLKEGAPGYAREAFAGPGGLNPELDPEQYADWAMHVFRSPEGKPVGYMSQGEGAVQGFAVDPNSPAALRAKAALQLAKPIIQNRLDPGEVTYQGADMVSKLQKLARRALRQ